MSDDFPRIIAVDNDRGITTIASGWAYPSNLSDPKNRRPMALVVVQVSTRAAEQELARLRAWSEPAEPPFSKAALDRLEYGKPPPRRR